MNRIPILLPAVLLSAAPAAAQLGAGQATYSGTRVLDHPCGTADARFGESTVVLDMAASGELDIAVGAWGEGAVYVFYGAGTNPGTGPYEEVRVFDATGPQSCPLAPRTDRFGYDVAKGQLDLDLPDELVVGAPSTRISTTTNAGAVYIIGGVTGTTPVALRAAVTEPGWLGTSVVVGDFDADGQVDIAASAPKAQVSNVNAGKVHVFFGPFDQPPVELVIENPFPVANANFGNHLAVGDANGDGKDDLYVSGIGNTAKEIPVAGQIFCYPAPIDPALYKVIEDPNPNPADLPGPRYGMHIDARDQWLAVGANRKDWLSVHDAGLGFTYMGPTFASVRLYEHPTPQASDYMGFRAAIANVIGDSTFDFTFVAMPNTNLPNANALALLIWNGRHPNGQPDRIIEAIPGSGDHFGNGLHAADLVPGGYEELIVGDPTYDAPSTNQTDNTGRVVIYYVD